MSTKKWIGKARYQGYLRKKDTKISNNLSQIYAILDSLDVLRIYNNKNDSRNENIKPKICMDLHELYDIKSNKINNINVWDIELIFLSKKLYLQCVSNEIEYKKWWNNFNKYIFNRKKLIKQQNYILYSGDIIKRGNINKKEWNNKHFVLISNNILEYYENKKNFEIKSKPNGIINLNHIGNIEEYSGDNDFESLIYLYSNVIYMKRTWVLQFKYNSEGHYHWYELFAKIISKNKKSNDIKHLCSNDILNEDSKNDDSKNDSKNDDTFIADLADDIVHDPKTDARKLTLSYVKNNLYDNHNNSNYESSLNESHNIVNDIEISKMSNSTSDGSSDIDIDQQNKKNKIKPFAMKSQINNSVLPKKLYATDDDSDNEANNSENESNNNVTNGNINSIPPQMRGYSVQEPYGYKPSINGQNYNRAAAFSMNVVKMRKNSDTSPPLPSPSPPQPPQSYSIEQNIQKNVPTNSVVPPQLNNMNSTVINNDNEGDIEGFDDSSSDIYNSGATQSDSEDMYDNKHNNDTNATGNNINTNAHLNNIKYNNNINNNDNSSDDDETEVDKLNKLIEKVEDEIITSEQVYLHALNVLLNEFLLELFRKKIIDEDRYSIKILSNLPMIINFHEQLSNSLQSNRNLICQTFKDQCFFFKMYSHYINNYDRLLELLHSNEFKRNKRLQNFLKSKVNENKPIESFLILPIQRVPRYKLLLTELKKYLNKKIDLNTKNNALFDNTSIHDKLNSLTEALNNITLICNDINEKKKQIDAIKQCIKIQNKLKGLKSSILKPHRKFIKEYKLKKKIKQKHVSMVIYLFNDIIILTKRKRVQTILMIKDVIIRRHGALNEFELVCKIKKFSDKFEAKNLEEVVNFEDNFNDCKRSVLDKQKRINVLLHSGRTDAYARIHGDDGGYNGDSKDDIEISNYKKHSGLEYQEGNNDSSYESSFEGTDESSDDDDNNNIPPATSHVNAAYQKNLKLLSVKSVDNAMNEYNQNNGIGQWNGNPYPVHQHTYSKSHYDQNEWNNHDITPLINNNNNNINNHNNNIPPTKVDKKPINGGNNNNNNNNNGNDSNNMDEMNDPAYIERQRKAFEEFERKLKAKQNNNGIELEEVPSKYNNNINSNSNNNNPKSYDSIFNELKSMGFQSKFIEIAFKLYHRKVGYDYNIETLAEYVISVQNVAAKRKKTTKMIIHSFNICF